MRQPPLPRNEADRLRSLASYALTPDCMQGALNALLIELSGRLSVAMAVVCMVDEGRQFFVARAGMAQNESPRADSICAHALEGSDLLVVGDALQDERFQNLDCVLRKPHIRFYAGAPLRLGNEHVLGTVCVMGVRPRDGLTEQEAALLRQAASRALRTLDHHRDARLAIMRRAFDRPPQLH